MSWLTITWSMIAAACAMLGLIQVFLWLHNPRDRSYPLSAAMAFSAAVVALLELVLFSTPDPTHYQSVLLWQNLAIALVVVPLVWFIHEYLPGARRWIALTITALWGVGLVVNFVLPGNLTFMALHELDMRTTLWGENFYVPRGVANPWKWLPDITVVLIPLYVIDASVRAWEKGLRERNGVIIGGVLLFVVFAGVEAIMVDAGVIEMPYMVGVGFLAIVLAQTWVLARDAVTARRLAHEVEATRREAERMMRTTLLGEIASALAHELNQPLAAILSNAQAAQKILAGSDPDLGEIREIVDDIVRDDKRAGEVIHGVRAMLRSGEVREEVFDLEGVTRDAIEFVRADFASQGIHVHVDSDAGVPPVRGGRVALQQVVLNLVVNAQRAMIDANSHVRTIHISLHPEKAGVRVEVLDSGPGIDETTRPRLFEPFFTTRDGGIGMGLTVSRRIVEAHGGRISAENADSGGACFSVWLPAAS